MYKALVVGRLGIYRYGSLEDAQNLKGKQMSAYLLGLLKTNTAVIISLKDVKLIGSIVLRESVFCLKIYHESKLILT